MDLKQIENLMKLMTKFQVDLIEVDGLKISKKIHQGPKLPKKDFTLSPAATSINQDLEDDVMFASTNAPKLTLEEFSKFSSNPVKENK